MVLYRFLLTFFPIALYHLSISAGTTDTSGPCSSTETHLDPSTHKLISQCADYAYCPTPNNGTCVPRLCRRDEFPFGYPPNITLPALCPEGQFCPDVGSGCRPRINPGGTCELNRDEQCVPPPDWNELASLNNFNGSICLRSTCMYANMTLGQQCVSDKTTYIDTGPGGEQFSFTIFRDNCRSPQFYCDPTNLFCQGTKPVGSACQLDNECELQNCNAANTCAEPPETPFRVATWQWGVTAISIIGGMVTVCVLLTFIHRRHRYARYAELQEYYDEQMNLRHSIIKLHAAAADKFTDEHDEEGMSGDEEGDRLIP